MDGFNRRIPLSLNSEIDRIESSKQRQSQFEFDLRREERRIIKVDFYSLVGKLGRKLSFGEEILSEIA